MEGFFNILQQKTFYFKEILFLVLLLCSFSGFVYIALYCYVNKYFRDDSATRNMLNINLTNIKEKILIFLKIANNMIGNVCENSLKLCYFLTIFKPFFSLKFCYEILI